MKNSAITRLKMLFSLKTTSRNDIWQTNSTLTASQKLQKNFRRLIKTKKFSIWGDF